MLIGKSASAGTAVGRALVIKVEPLHIERKSIKDVAAEISRLASAIETAKSELIAIRDQVRATLGKDKAEIFEAHLLVLEDPELIEETQNLIRDDKVNAESAYKQVAQQFITMFETMDNEYMRERATDIRDISDRVLRTLTGVSIVNLSVLKDDVIIVAHDLTPSETATMNREKVLGILTNVGGKTSHTAIMARTLEIPAVLGLRDITETVKSGDWIAFDGESGQVFLNPTEAKRKKFLEKKEQEQKAKGELQKLVGLATKSKDGVHIELVGNIGTPQDIKSLLKYDAEGVGLYRTEFLFMDREEMPTEEEQYLSYKVVLESMGKKPVIIRTLDVGGDKSVPYIDIGKEQNPFLGYRAIRYCLDHKDLFRTQLRALLRASVHGNLGIMFPMISNLEELQASRAELESVRSELRAENIPVADKFQVGIMIEIPSAAMISDVLAQHCDFLSIGTNDLIQYTVAVDRLNERVQHLYDPYHPGVLRLIKLVIDNAHNAGKWAGMCGEMAGSELHLPLLFGMGLDEFSMAPTAILRTRKLLQAWTKSEAKELVNAALKLSTGAEIEALLKQVFKN